MAGRAKEAAKHSRCISYISHPCFSHKKRVIKKNGEQENLIPQNRFFFHLPPGRDNSMEGWSLHRKLVLVCLAQKRLHNYRVKVLLGTAREGIFPSLSPSLSLSVSLSFSLSFFLSLSLSLFLCLTLQRSFARLNNLPQTQSIIISAVWRTIVGCFSFQFK